PFVVSETAPDIEGFAASPPRIGKHGTETVTFAMDRDLGPQGSLAVAFGGQPMTCSQTGAAPTILFTCTYAMTGAEIQDRTEQIVAITADATDAAGNTTRKSASVIVDFRAPSLVGATVSPPVARDGSVVALAVTTDEALSSPAGLEWTMGR